MMNQFVLKDRELIDAAIVDIDTRQIAEDARKEFSEKYGAIGHKVVIAAQEGSAGTEVQAVTYLKFDRSAANGFVTVGQDKDGCVLALPDLRTQRGQSIANEMANLPDYSNQLSKSLGFVPKIENGKVSFGVSSVEEIGREIVVGTPYKPSNALGVEPLAAEDYAALKQGAHRLKDMIRENAPNPYAK